MNKIIIIGGAKFLKNLNAYVDSFDRVCRINFVLPNGNNGTRLDIQFVKWNTVPGLISNPKYILTHSKLSANRNTTKS